MADDKPHIVDLEATGGEQLALIRNLMQQIKLTDDIVRMKLEIESTSPIIREESDSVSESEPDETDEPEPDETDEPEPDETDEPEQEEHITDELVQESAEAEIISNEPDSIEDINLTPDTQKWNVARLFYHVDGCISTKQAVHMLEDDDSTPDNLNYLSAVICNCVKDGILFKKDEPGETNVYQMTELGRKKMEETNAETVGWDLFDPRNAADNEKKPMPS